MQYQELFDRDRALVENWLASCLADRPACGRLIEGMDYSLMAGGKRIRPVLALETCRMCGGDVEAALPFACAVEMVHTYSLIHDDLPCMDNDDLRRGKLTNHKVFGEAAAVLAGDALLTAAFETMCRFRGSVGDAKAAAAMDCLSTAAGASGMVGGQILDMEGEGKRLTVAELERLQTLKTGALISAAAEVGAILAGAEEERRAAVRTYAQCIGRAFQIRDDMLDVAGDVAVLGKPIGSDAENEKSTFVTALGMDECARRVNELTDRAVQALDCFEDHGFLDWLAMRLAGRDR